MGSDVILYNAKDIFVPSSMLKTAVARKTWADQTYNHLKTQEVNWVEHFDRLSWHKIDITRRINSVEDQDLLQSICTLSDKSNHGMTKREFLVMLIDFILCPGKWQTLWLSLQKGSFPRHKNMVCSRLLTTTNHMSITTKNSSNDMELLTVWWKTWIASTSGLQIGWVWIWAEILIIFMEIWMNHVWWQSKESWRFWVSMIKNMTNRDGNCDTKKIVWGRTAGISEAQRIFLVKEKRLEYKPLQKFDQTH